MIELYRLQGYKAGVIAARAAKERNLQPKRIVQELSVNDRDIAKQIQEELKMYNVRWKRCFNLAVQYSFGFDDGVRCGAFE